MTTSHGKTPVTAPTVNEGNELGTGSSFTAYLAKHGDNTRHTFGTWSGESVPHKGHITVILDIDSVAQMMDDGPVLVQINPGCVAKHDEHVRRYRAEQAEQERKRIRRELSDRITEEEGFEQQLAALDAKATAIYAQIDKKVNAILNAEEKNS